MASYLSYFTSNSTSTPNQQQYSQSQATTSTWTGTFSSRIAGLRKALTKDSEEDDPDNEDCSHVSNVLRAYYAEKGRGLPEWLPPDPKKPAPIPQAQPQYGQYGQYGNAYGNQYGQPTHNRASSGGGGLSDLWDSTPAPRPTPQSLRAPRQPVQASRGYDNTGRQGSSDGYGGPNTQQTLGGRPSLPSQRSGSFQNAPQTSAPVHKSDRLKARLQAGGSGRNSPASNQSSQNPYSDSAYASGQGPEAGNTPYTLASQPWSNAGGYDNYSAGGGQYNRRPGGPR